MGKDLLGSIELNRVYQFDCVEGMRTLLPDNFIDLTVTSPPYDNLRKYSGYSFDFENLANELYRITKPGGVVVWVVGDATVKGSETGTSFKQALYFKEIGFKLHDTMIFQKASPPIIPTVKRYQPNFEYMFVFVKGKLETFNPIRIPKLYEDKRTSKKYHRNSEGEFVTGNKRTQSDLKIKENVWHYAVGGGNMTKDKVAHSHPAMFPEKLAEDHILSWSNENDIVFDPFAGSGTTMKMAQLNNRKYLGFEISSEYIEIINKRLESIQEDFRSN